MFHKENIKGGSFAFGVTLFVLMAQQNLLGSQMALLLHILSPLIPGMGLCVTVMYSDSQCVTVPRNAHFSALKLTESIESI